MGGETSSDAGGSSLIAHPWERSLSISGKLGTAAAVHGIDAFMSSRMLCARQLSRMLKPRTFKSSRLLSTTARASPAFALAPYQSSRKGSRKAEFCMLTMDHPMVHADSQEIVLSAYLAKAYLLEDQVEELFQLYDVDGSGALDRSELTQAMEGIGLVPTEERAAKLLDFHDDSRDGTLQREEFAALIHHIWGGPIAVNFSDSLGALYADPELADHRVFMWLGCVS